MGRRKKRMFLTMTVITAMSSALVAGVPRVADAAQLSVNAVKEKYVVVTDELGHKVKIPTDPKRVLAPKMEDSLVALGMTPIAQEEAGGLVQTYLQKYLKGVPTFDFSHMSPESVLKINPDLMILNSPPTADEYEEYSKRFVWHKVVE